MKQNYRYAKMLPIMSDVCLENHFGYTALSIIMLFVGGMLGVTVPIQEFLETDAKCGDLERQLREKNTKLQETQRELSRYKTGVNVSVRFLNSMSSENSDSSDTDV